MYSPRVRLPIGTAAVILTLTVVGYVSSGTPVPRPTYLFVGVAVALTLLLFAVLHVRSLSRSDIFAIGGIAVLIGAFLRFSAFITVITSGVDHTRWVQRVQDNIAANGITGTDMYASAPLYLLELGMGQQLFGLSAFETRFITLTIASVTPVVLGTLTYYLTDDAKTGLVAVLVGTPQFLFLRTSALLEAESLAILWYSVTILLLIRYLQTRDSRLFAIFFGILLTSVFLHFLYAVILFCTIAGVLGLLAVINWGTSLDTPVSWETGVRLMQATGIAGLFIPLWILTSTYGGVALDVLRSFFPRDTNEDPTDPVTETPEGTPEGMPEGSPSTAPSQSNDPSQRGTAQEEGTSLLDAVADFILPQSGTIAQSVGISGGPLSETLLALFPFVLFCSAGGIGGIVAVLRRKAYDILLLTLLLTVGLMAVIGVFLDLQYQLGYRLYYFVGVLLVVAASLGLRHSTASAGPVLVALLLVGAFLPYAAMGPMSPLGNNVDPQFGGTNWHFTQSEYDQLASLDDQFAYGEIVESDVPQVPNNINIRSIESTIRLTRGTCMYSQNRIADSGDISLCSGDRGEIT